MKAVKPAEERVIVDTTVQDKAIAQPTDSRLLEIARHKVASAGRRCGIAVRQSFAKDGKTLLRADALGAREQPVERLDRPGAGGREINLLPLHLRTSIHPALHLAHRRTRIVR